MKARILTAVPLMAIVLAIILLGSNLLVGVISIILLAAVYLEVLRLFRGMHPVPSAAKAVTTSASREMRIIGGIVVVLLLGLFLIPRSYVVLHWRPFLTLFGLMASFSFTLASIRYIRLALKINVDQSEENQVQDRVGEGVLSLNIFLALLFLPFYHALPQLVGGIGIANCLLLLVIPVWVGDIAAIFIGKALGKRKLAPQISPGKTWEGAVGNFIYATLAGMILGPICGLCFWGGLVVGLIAGTIGQIGDLTESSLKRLAKMKDSGSLLPGHGGIYDRIDSLIAVSSFFWIPLVLFLK